MIRNVYGVVNKCKFNIMYIYFGYFGVCFEVWVYVVLVIEIEIVKGMFVYLV